MLFLTWCNADSHIPICLYVSQSGPRTNAARVWDPSSVWTCMDHIEKPKAVGQCLGWTSSQILLGPCPVYISQARLTNDHEAQAYLGHVIYVISALHLMNCPIKTMTISSLQDMKETIFCHQIYKCSVQQWIVCDMWRACSYMIPNVHVNHFVTIKTKKK